MKIQIQPYYNKRMSDAYPSIAKRLSGADEAWVEIEPSLFHIVGKLDSLLYKLEGDEPFREILLNQKKPLQGLYETVEENIADWKLAKVDAALYKIEDIFDEIERELGKI
jgi:hypothetical protein